MTTTPTDSVRTIVACLTPSGTAAIATLGVHGPDAWTVCCDLFTPRTATLPETPSLVKGGRFWLGRLGEAMKDEAVLTLRQASPVPWVELHCHGGRQVVEMLLDLFRERGIAVCSWEEWERTTANNPLRAEAAIALARALTPRTAAILLDQYQGAFERALETVKTTLDRQGVQESERLLADLLRHAALGRRLTVPWRVVVAGAPNVGKSSLVNALAGFQRSVVSGTPGTTRDVVTTLVAIDGWPVELADTAGLRAGGESLEEMGIGLARSATESADLCLWVVDASESPTWPGKLPTPTLPIVNKIDLPAAWNVSEAEGALHVSAHTGAGLSELCEALSRRLVPNPPSPGAAVPVGPEWCERLERVREACAAGEGAEARALLAR